MPRNETGKHRYIYIYMEIVPVVIVSILSENFTSLLHPLLMIFKEKTSFALGRIKGLSL